MISCRQARRVIVDCVREESGEADRLLLEEHLANCRSCREERGRWALLERLRDGTSATLSADARARVLDQLMTTPVTEAPLAREARPMRPMLLGLMAGVAALLAVAWGRNILSPGVRPVAGKNVAVAVDRNPSPASSPTVNPPTLVHAETAGTTSLSGVKVAYPAGTTWRWGSNQREIHLLEGEVDVDVTPGGPGNFRVISSHFIVVVLGTRFVVRADGVKTLRGHVRVESFSGKTLAMLGAGESWSLAPQDEQDSRRDIGLAEASPESPSVAPVRRLAAKPLPSPPSLDLLPDLASAPSAAPSESARLLGEAKQFLVSGDTTRARERIASALAAKPSLRERARAELLAADAFLVERQRTQALVAYQRTGDLFATLPEGESAAFMVAQLLSEQGTPAEARAAFEHYLSRHPGGRFAHEARDKLATLSQP